MDKFLKLLNYKNYRGGINWGEIVIDVVVLSASSVCLYLLAYYV